MDNASPSGKTVTNSHTPTKSLPSSILAAKLRSLLRNSVLLLISTVATGSSDTPLMKTPPAPPVLHLPLWPSSVASTTRDLSTLIPSLLPRLRTSNSGSLACQPRTDQVGLNNYVLYAESSKPPPPRPKTVSAAESRPHSGPPGRIVLTPVNGVTANNVPANRKKSMLISHVCVIYCCRLTNSILLRPPVPAANPNGTINLDEKQFGNLLSESPIMVPLSPVDTNDGDSSTGPPPS